MNAQEMDKQGTWFFSFSDNKGKTFNTYGGGLKSADVKVQTDRVWNDDEGRPEDESKNWTSKWDDISITRGRSVWRWTYVNDLISDATPANFTP